MNDTPASSQSKASSPALYAPLARPLLLVYLPLLFIATHTSEQDMPQGDAFRFELLHADKVLHAGAYGLLTALLIGSALLGRSRSRVGNVLLGGLLAAIYACVDEYTQNFVGRTGSFADLAADLGAVAAVTLAGLVTRSIDGRADFKDTQGDSRFVGHALLMAGLPPLTALGTNKLQATMGSGTATLRIFLSRKLNFSDVKYLMLSAFMGSLIGSIGVQFVNSEMLSWLIPIALTGILIYFIKPQKKPCPSATPEPKVSSKNYHRFVIPSIGLYDGVLGAGTGSFMALAGVSCRNQDLIHATATAKQFLGPHHHDGRRRSVSN